MIDFERDSHFTPNKIIMSYETIDKMKSWGIKNGYYFDGLETIYGMRIHIDRGLRVDMIKVSTDEFKIDPYRFRQITPSTVKFTPSYNTPKYYIINKGATILFWEDGSKTIVKRNKEDDYNKRLGFLTAYFQKTSGMSKTKANKYLDSLMDEDELKAEQCKEFSDFMDEMRKAVDETRKKFWDSLKK